MRPVPLPSELGSGVFTTAQATGLGVPASRLRRSDLVHPTRGVHARSVPVGLVERACGYLAGLPQDRAFSHTTAALLLGLPLPAHLEREASEGPLHIMAPTPDGQTRRRGCRGHRGLESRSTTVVQGLPVVSPEDTWCDLGELGRRRVEVDDLVVVGDAVIRFATEDVAPAWPLRRALEARVRPRGKLMLGEALALVRPGVRSPMETRGRLMFVRAGFPEPEVNGELRDRHGGWLAEGDLVWREQRVVGEYQGVVHADRRRRSRDASRRHTLGDEGWRVLEIWAEDVHVPGRRIASLLRFARALELDVGQLRIG
jgi:hypothetical protein